MAALAPIRSGDIVEVNVKGRRALAFAKGKRGGRLEIEPITKGFGWLTVGSRDVVAHWRKTKNVRKIGARKTPDDEGVE